MAGKNFNAAAGGTVRTGFREELLDAPPAETSWIGVLHQIFDSSTREFQPPPSLFGQFI